MPSGKSGSIERYALSRMPYLRGIRRLAVANGMGMMASVALRTPVALFGNIDAIGLGRSWLAHIGGCATADLLVCRRAEKATSTTRMEMWRREKGRGILDHDREDVRLLTSAGRVEVRGERTILNGMTAVDRDK